MKSTSIWWRKNILVISNPFLAGHGCRTQRFAGVGGQQRYVSQVQLQYKPGKMFKIINSIYLHTSYWLTQ